MSYAEDFSKHATYVGRILANLSTLETMARACLHVATGQKSTAWDQWFSLRVGDSVDKDEFTSYDSLGKVLRRYNAKFPKAAVDDKTVVMLRDALAHGKAVSDRVTFPLTMVKFGSEKNGDGKVEVEFRAEMTWQWFEDQLALVKRTVTTVYTQLQSIQPAPPAK